MGVPCVFAEAGRGMSSYRRECRFMAVSYMCNEFILGSVAKHDVNEGMSEEKRKEMAGGVFHTFRGNLLSRIQNEICICPRDRACFGGFSSFESRNGI